jgi:hypothetical protein
MASTLVQGGVHDSLKSAATVSVITVYWFLGHVLRTFSSYQAIVRLRPSGHNTIAVILLAGYQPEDPSLGNKAVCS